MCVVLIKIRGEIIAHSEVLTQVLVAGGQSLHVARNFDYFTHQTAQINWINGINARECPLWLYFPK
jgi:hypothetical protein